MNFQKPTFRFVAVGLLLLVSGFWLKRLFPIPDVVDGLLKGAGFGLMMVALLNGRPHKTS